MKIIFKFLNKANKVILPSYRSKDLTQLSKFDKIIVGYRYYVLIKSLKQ